jgi:N-methylhydantoinase A/oxoprolinase/acetone carboxylase beta subunit
VTDADLVLGRIPVDATFPELGRLDRAAAERALDGANVNADGIARVVDAAMVRAVRVVTVERGVDPRDLALVAFGGAGPLHACAVAEALGMRAVIVPPRAGVCSAVGLLCAPRARTIVRSFTGGSLSEARARVEDEARALVGPEAAVESAVDCRYEGQSHEITVATLEAFPEEHLRRNGHSRPGAPIEIVAVRARALSAAPLSIRDLPVADRSSARGPVVLAEPDCTIWIPGGWRAEPRALGALVLERT